MARRARTRRMAGGKRRHRRRASRNHANAVKVENADAVAEDAEVTWL